MSDRGICDNCGKPAVMHEGGWLCPNCGSERPSDRDRDVTKRVKPSGSYVWRR